jgi:hypothetical protein
LIAKELSFFVTTKSLQQYENKGKSATQRALKSEHRGHRRLTPGGNADGCENEGVGEKAIGKSMKTKGEESGEWRERAKAAPHTRCVCVNAVDKGVSGRFGAKAVDKGLIALGSCGNKSSGGEKGGLNGDTVRQNLALAIAATVAGLRLAVATKPRG